MKKQKETKPSLPADLSTEALAKAGQPTPSMQPVQSDKAHKPAQPFVFNKSVFTSPFAKGLKLKQDNRGKFFARTRRGSI